MGVLQQLVVEERRQFRRRRPCCGRARGRACEDTLLQQHEHEEEVASAARALRALVVLSCSVVPTGASQLLPEQRLQNLTRAPRGVLPEVPDAGDGVQEAVLRRAERFGLQHLGVRPAADADLWVSLGLLVWW